MFGFDVVFFKIILIQGVFSGLGGGVMISLKSEWDFKSWGDVLFFVS